MLGMIWGAWSDRRTLLDSDIRRNDGEGCENDGVPLLHCEEVGVVGLVAADEVDVYAVVVG